MHRFVEGRAGVEAHPAEAELCHFFFERVQESPA